MLDIKFIRENPEKVKENCRNRSSDPDNVTRVLSLDFKRRKLLQKVEQKRAEQNKISKQGIDSITTQKAKTLKEEIKTLEKELEEVEKNYIELAWQLPNMVLDEVPIGKDERDNKIIKKQGEPDEFDFPIKDHLELGERLDLIDVERAAKVSGARFTYLKGEVALIEFALINFALDNLLKKGFIPILPPVMLKSEMARGMGYLEQTDEQEAYYLSKDDLYLVGTSEQSIGVMHAGEVFEEKDLPRRYVGFSTCFRREAGSYGKDTRGIVRVHQFDKIEMFVFCKPEDSPKEHQFLLGIEEELMQALELPYQMLHLCSGDIGRPSANTFDIETWMPSQNKYRETHSCSNCTDFQARRLNIKYKNPKTRKADFVHMLNGTAIAVPRILVAILENYQTKDGSIEVPKVLQKYLGFKQIPKK